MAFLIVENQPDRYLELDQAATVGREEGCTWVLDDPMVSRHHLEITRDGDGYTFEDLGSTHGTFVEGTRVERGRLDEGTSLRVGDTVLVFRGTRPGAAAEAPPGRRMELGIEPPQFLAEAELIDGARLRYEYERLRATYEVTVAVGAETDPVQVMDRILDCVFRLLSADRGVMILVDEEGRPLTKRGRNREGKPVLADIPQALLHEVATKRRASLTADAVCDQRFSRSESIMAERIRSAMTVPVVWRENLIGVLQVDTQSAVNAFGRRDLDLFTTIASHAALALYSASLQERLRLQERQRRQEVQRVLDGLPVAVVLVDHEGGVDGANPEARRLLPELGRQGTLGAKVTSLGGHDVTELLGQVSRVPMDIELSTAPKPLIATISGARHEDPATHRTTTVLSLQDVTERREQDERTREALAAQQAAEAASEAKSRFLAHMSHEIRTPLNAVLGMSELALGLESSGELREYLETIAASAGSLLHMVNDVLDLSKIEADRIEIEKVRVRLPNLLQRVLPGLVAQMKAKGLAFRATVGDDVPTTIFGDPTRLQQILVNLLGNAMKFTADGEISLTMRVVGRDRLRFEVADSGIGMTAPQLESIFEAFQQADATTTRRFGGTGLGLSISRRLAELMDGRLWATSTEGEGSVFHFELPLMTHREASVPAGHRRALVVAPGLDGPGSTTSKVRRAGAEATHASSIDDLVSALRDGAFDLVLVHAELGGAETVPDRISSIAPETRCVLILPPGRVAGISRGGYEQTAAAPLFADDVVQLLEGRRLATAEPSSAPTRALRLLVVDDHPVNRKVAERMLSRMGHEVSLADSGRAALAAVGEPGAAFDAVFMDVQMPEMDGLEATRAIRTLSGPMAEVAVVALTGCATKEDERRCREAGMTGYLPKPIKSALLAEVLGGLDRA